MKYDFSDWLWFISGAILFGSYSLKTNKVSPSGALSGIFIAAILFYFTFSEGVVYFISFFLLGSFASKWKLDKKKDLGIEQENKGKRTHIHAFCNAGAAAFYPVALFFFFDQLTAISLVVASVFAAALSDTLSSELGNVLGKRYYNILTLKSDIRGKDGVISFEGTLIGLIGAIIIAIIHFAYHQNILLLVIIIISGFTSNVLDSLLGASLQRSGILTNHTVNLTITFFSGLFALLLYSIYLHSIS